jgi:hypothetical protein
LSGSPHTGAQPRRLTAACLQVFLAALLIATTWASLHSYAKRPQPTAQTERLYFPSGRFLREATLGFREVVADYVWFQTVQYYGGYRQGDHDLAYFRNLVRSVVTLDPRFVEAYTFGSLVLAIDMHDPEGGIDILKQGALANPDSWLMPFEIGFIHYVFFRDYPRAAVWFEAAAAVPGATDFVRRFAAYSHKRAGDVEVSLVLWRNLYENTTNPRMKELAVEMIRQCEELLRQEARSTRREGA